MNGKELNGKRLYVGSAQTKAERQVELKQPRHQGVNLYLKYLEGNTDDDKLHKDFFRDHHQYQGDEDRGPTKARALALWASPSPEEATKAVAEMKGRIVSTKPLYVAPTQNKAQRVKFLTNK